MPNAEGLSRAFEGGAACVLALAPLALLGTLGLRLALTGDLTMELSREGDACDVDDGAGAAI